MNLTLTQAIDRAKDLSGILKAARAHEADCAADHVAKLNIATIAAEAHEKAVSACVELEQEREALADHIAALVRKVGDPLELDTQEPLAVLPDATSHLALQHASDCAVHNEPAFPAAPCDCGAVEGSSIRVTYNSIFTEGADFQAQALSNGLDRIGEALDAARS